MHLYFLKVGYDKGMCLLQEKAEGGEKAIIQKIGERKWQKEEKGIN